MMGSHLFFFSSLHTKGRAAGTERRQLDLLASPRPARTLPGPALPCRENRKQKPKGAVPLIVFY